MTSASAPSLLVIHPGGLGDVLLSLPAIAEVHRRLRRLRVILVAGAAVGELLIHCQVVDHVLTAESGALALLMGGTLSPSLRHLLAGCEVAIGWLRDGDGQLERTLRRLGVSSVRLASPVPIRGVHQSRRFWEVLGNPGPMETRIPRLMLPTELRELAAQHLRMFGVSDPGRLILCHPGSGSPHKCVGAGIMAKAITGLRQAGYRVAVVGGPADTEAVAALVRQGLRDIPVIEQQTLPITAGMLAHARLFLGHDSGVGHLAAAVGTPTIALFGPTDPSQWAPLGDHVSIITGPACSCSTWAQVQACELKPCLAIEEEAIMAACLQRLAATPK